ncbi:MAG: AAA family ATPase [Chthoniobacter sp.]|uniref:AAA family ATPase n=1 Tax=Chthoniobacter sp. TaxID=2510640 RepID=UPI0032A452AA
MPPPDFLRSCRIINFKAIRDTLSLKLTPLTVFIGNNGSGKSSVVEALRTLKVMSEMGFDAGMNLWRGVEHAYHKAPPPPLGSSNKDRASKRWGLSFQLRGRAAGKPAAFRLDLFPTKDRDRIHRAREWHNGKLHSDVRFDVHSRTRSSGVAALDLLPLLEQAGFGARWQFLTLVPEKMMPPVLRHSTQGRVVLREDGTNIAEYLEEIRNWEDSGGAYDAIMRTLRFVLPYLEEVRPETASTVEKTLYLSLVEPSLIAHSAAADRKRATIPGWMMSTGTLRALAIIAVLRHPDPPSLLVVEEIENSLDPRTLGLVMEEIRTAVKSRRTQVILTTHSPQLLDVTKLDEVVFVKRDEGREPRFLRPADEPEARKLASEFTLGEMLGRGLFGQVL